MGQSVYHLPLLPKEGVSKVSLRELAVIQTTRDFDVDLDRKSFQSIMVRAGSDMRVLLLDVATNTGPGKETAILNSLSHSSDDMSILGLLQCHND
eukprot:g44893.t1